jgi:hypothetical protein
VDPDAHAEVDAVGCAQLASEGLERAWIASAATTARRGASSSASGAPNNAITPSPRNWFTVPS